MARPSSDVQNKARRAAAPSDYNQPEEGGTPGPSVVLVKDDRRWIAADAEEATNLRARGWRDEGSPAAAARASSGAPEGSPSASWSVAQIDAYAEKAGVQVSGNKAAKLKALRDATNAGDAPPAAPAGESAGPSSTA